MLCDTACHLPELRQCNGMERDGADGDYSDGPQQHATSLRMPLQRAAPKFHGVMWFSMEE